MIFFRQIQRNWIIFNGTTLRPLTAHGTVVENLWHRVYVNWGPCLKWDQTGQTWTFARTALIFLGGVGGVGWVTKWLTGLPHDITMTQGHFTHSCSCRKGHSSDVKCSVIILADTRFLCRFNTYIPFNTL